MKSISFEFYEHVKCMYDWSKARSSYFPDEVYEIPEHGLVILDISSKPICMGFIRKIEGGYGLIDSYLSDPSQSPKDRDEALDLLTKDLVNLAKQLGILRLLANTMDSNTLERSLKHGFSRLPHTLMVIRL